MSDKFKIIAITPDYFFEEEANQINQIFSENKADLVHLRKPSASLKEMKTLVSKINENYHHRLKLHDHFELLDKFNLGGIHLNRRNPLPYPNSKSISISIHSFNEIEETLIYDYFFISPVFDSISKEGYKSTFDLLELSEKIKGKNAIALGGVTPKKFPLLRSYGFSGAAMLGYFFFPNP